MVKQEWLQSLKPGHKVAIPSTYGNNYSIGTVLRITKTKIVVNMDSARQIEFRTSDGYQKGVHGRYSSFHTTNIVPLTDEIKAKIRHANRLHCAQNIKLERLNSLQLKCILLIAEKPQLADMVNDVFQKAKDELEALPR